jgi:hypothetical protein
MHDQSMNNREALGAHIASLTASLADADQALKHERNIENQLAFSFEQSTHAMQSTVLGMRNALAHHRAMVMRAGELCAESVRFFMRRKDSGEAARAIFRDKERVVMFAQQALADEFMLGHLSRHSRAGKLINDFRTGIDLYEHKANAEQPKQKTLVWAHIEDIPVFAHSSERILATLANPASCRKIGTVAHALTSSLLGITSLALRQAQQEKPSARFLTAPLYPLLNIVKWMRKKLYARWEMDRNTKGRLTWAKRDDSLLTRILGTRVTVLHDYMLSRHDMLKWNAAVLRLPDELRALGVLRREWAAQVEVTRKAAEQREQVYSARNEAMTRYEGLYGNPWRTATSEPIPDLAPSPHQQSSPKKIRSRRQYDEESTQDQASEQIERVEYFVTRESKQWKADLAELSEDQRRTFATAAQAIPRSQARKPLGRSNGRLLYTLPVGNSHRLVYSIDAGIAVLERAFGLASHAEDYRKCRKDIQNWRI